MGCAGMGTGAAIGADGISMIGLAVSTCASGAVAGGGDDPTRPPRPPRPLPPLDDPARPRPLVALCPKACPFIPAG